MSVGLTAALIIGILLCLEFGRRIGQRQRNEHPSDSGTGTMTGAVFGLLALLVTFTFSGAYSRFETRRELITQEANAIGTAYLRLDLLAKPDRDALAAEVRNYTRARIDLFKGLHSLDEYDARRHACATQQALIWSHTLAALRNRGSDPDAGKMLIPALNEMFDITTTRHAASLNHPPNVIYAMLAVITLIAALLVGYQMGFCDKRAGLHIATFTLVMAITPYIILDLEYPRRRLIRVDDADRILVETLAGMN